MKSLIEVTLTAVRSECARFDRWEGDLSATADPAEPTMDGPKHVQAWFSLEPLRLHIFWRQGMAGHEPSRPNEEAT